MTIDELKSEVSNLYKASGDTLSLIVILYFIQKAFDIGYNYNTYNPFPQLDMPNPGYKPDISCVPIQECCQNITPNSIQITINGGADLECSYSQDNPRQLRIWPEPDED